MEFREGLSSDADSLADVLAAAFDTYLEWTGSDWHPQIDVDERERERLRRRLGQPDVWCRLAESDGVPVGYVVLTAGWTREEPREPIEGLAHIWHIFVLPGWWGSGVAGRLLGDAMAEAARLGYRDARLWTPRDNGRARAFYRREGWRESGAERYAADVDLALVEYRLTLPGLSSPCDSL
jgi:GNAT superfamily N-acetyltransferase